MSDCFVWGAISATAFWVVVDFFLLRYFQRRSFSAGFDLGYVMAKDEEGRPL